MQEREGAVLLKRLEAENKEKYSQARDIFDSTPLPDGVTANMNVYLGEPVYPSVDINEAEEVGSSTIEVFYENMDAHEPATRYFDEMKASLKEAGYQVEPTPNVHVDHEGSGSFEYYLVK